MALYLLAVFFSTPMAALATLAGAASIPVIIHLLNRRRYQIVDWGAMRFLQAALKRSVRRLRFEHWLLLLVRILLVLLPLVAMAAATPWAESWWERLMPGAAGPPQFAGRTHHILVIDGSLSMTARTAESSAFERAQTQANSIVAAARGGDGFSLVQLSNPSRAIIPGPANDPGRVTLELNELAGTHGTADIIQGMQLVKDIVSRSSTQFQRRVVYVLTDLQKSQWTPPAHVSGSWLESWQQMNAEADVAFVDVGGSTFENLAVSSLTIDDPLISAGTSATATATVHNFGVGERKQVRLQWHLAKTNGPDAFPLRVIRQELIDIPANASATVATSVDFKRAGDYRLEVKIDDDVLATDNWRGTAINVVEEVPVLVVNGRPARSPWDTASGWLTAALDPFPAGQRPPGFPARPQVISDSKLDEPDFNLGRYGIVFLCDVPRFTPRIRDRLDSYVRGGGTIVFGLGPQLDAENYRRMLYQDGQGILPAQLTRRAKAADGQFFSFVFDDDAFRRPPLAAFAGDDERAGLASARFQEYWQIELAATTPARRIGRFSPSSGAGDPVFVEWSIGRGRTLLFTSTFNTQWSSWPIAPSFPPFIQELFRHAVQQPIRSDILVGEAIDEAVPDTTAATDAAVTTPPGRLVSIPIVTEQDRPRLRFTDTTQAGLYEVSIAGRSARTIIANCPAGPESDLQRANLSDLPRSDLGEPPTIVTDPARIPIRTTNIASGPLPPPTAGLGHIGTSLARWPLIVALLLLVLEPILAWRYGSARNATSANEQTATTHTLGWGYRFLSWCVLVMVALVAVTAFIVLHAAITGEVLTFLPNSMREWIERSLGVPPPVIGENTLWRLDRMPVFVDDSKTDRWLLGVIGFLILVSCGYVYYRELGRSARGAGWPMVGLRAGLALLLLLVLLPQLRLVFERAGWPDYIVVLDDSRSMGVADQYADPDYKAAIADLTDHQSTTSRLQLAQRLLTRRDHDWLRQLGIQRQSRLHVFRVSDRAARLAEIDNPQAVAKAGVAIDNLMAGGDSSRLGDAIRSIIEQFRGSALGGIMVLTDGITTDGDDCSTAARHASRAGVPLTFVGIGDVREPNDIAITDVRVDDVVHVGDRLVFEARVTPRGELRGSTPIVLFEKRGEQLVELARQDVVLGPPGVPVKVRVNHTPQQIGDAVFVLEVPRQTDESDVANNRLERSVLVTDAKKTRVLWIEGRPRNDYRFAKTLLERETESVRGNKSIELRVLLADADLDYARQDRTALESFPASKEELFRQFDVIILGDVEPNHALLGEKRLQWIADFVKEKGGGLLALCGSQAMPRAYRNTPLADLLPVDAHAVEPHGTTMPTGYKPNLTLIGRTHPALRFVPDEQENVQVWDKLKPFFWAADGLKPKPAAEVLATVGSSTAPLVLQQFVGGGRVLLIGFEESWRWRFRSDEVRFNQFWIQLVRFLARSRPSRAELRLDRQGTYRRGEPIRVTVQFPDDQPAPDGNTSVRVEMRHDDGQQKNDPTVLQLAAIPGAARTFSTIVARTPEGRYQFTFRESQSDKPRVVETRVLPPPGEMDQLRMNRDDLERAAQISRGRFYTITEVDRVMAELPPVPHVTLNQPVPPWPLWNTPLIVILGLSLVASEWVLRKRHHLL